LEKRENEPRDSINPGRESDNLGARPPAPSADIPPDEIGAPSIGQWLASNAFGLIVVTAALIYIFVNFDIEGVWAICKALLGLSLVIFIHELGHFLAAKWCDVNVTTFSIGFGPAIPGCWFQWGETVYKLALFPLGGYVQMLGQVDGDEASDGSEDDPRSYRNKGVGQRMLIISAGVIMNDFLAVACFIIVYQGKGKDRTAAVVSTLDASGPAWQNGVRTGMEVLQIGDVKAPNFEDLLGEVVFTDKGDKVRFVGQRPGDPTPLDIVLEPRLDAGDTRPVIGIGPSSRLELATRRLMGSSRPYPAVYGSPAARAQPALQYGDRIIATTDPDDPSKITELPVDPRNQQTSQRDYFEFHRRMALLAGQEATVRVRRAGNGETVDLKVPPAFHFTLGVRMQMGEITAIRAGSPAAQAGIQPPNKDKKLYGDLIEKIEVSEADGAWTTFDEKNLDPERLPYQLQQWSQRLDKAGAKIAKTVKLHLRRHRDKAGEQFEKIEVPLEWDADWRFEKVLPLHVTSPLAIPELGLAYHIKPVVAGVVEEQVESQLLQPGDVIQEMQAVVYVDNGREETQSAVRFEGNWAYVSYFLNHRYYGPAPVKKLTFKIQRAKEVQTVEMVPVADQAWPLDERGWLFMPDERRQKADTMSEAIAFGLKDTHNSMMQVVHTLGGMFKGRLSVKNLGGPITIAKTAYSIAGYDIWEFIFFLGLISINLAVINFLPIPVLDGGHMVFLLYEKLRGKPASEAVRVGATYAGLALILSLMVFVIYLDLTRGF
jgi:regulator of sigma E protease